MKVLSITDEVTKDARDLASGLSSMYAQYLGEDNSGSEGRTPGVHASELKCLRKTVYSIWGIDKKEEVPIMMKKKFRVGHALHDLFQRDFKKMAKQSGGRLHFKEEFPIDPFCNEIARRYNISSSCDGIFTFYDWVDMGPRKWWKPTLRVGLEIKTASPDSFKDLKGPLPEHVEQAHIYMACLDLPLMWFLYFNKGNENITTSDMQPYLIAFDHKVWAHLESRMEEAMVAAQMGVEPPREEGFHCKFCPYSYECQPAMLQAGVSKPKHKSIGGSR
jgi:hypothetical protein